MARLLLDVGQIQSERSWTDNQKIIDMLFIYYEALELGDDSLSPQQKLNLVRDSIIAHIVNVVHNHEGDKRIRAVMLELNDQYNLDEE